MPRIPHYAIEERSVDRPYLRPYSTGHFSRGDRMLDVSSCEIERESIREPSSGEETVRSTLVVTTDVILRTGLIVGTRSEIRVVLDTPTLGLAESYKNLVKTLIGLICNTNHVRDHAPFTEEMIQRATVEALRIAHVLTNSPNPNQFFYVVVIQPTRRNFYTLFAWSTADTVHMCIHERELNNAELHTFRITAGHYWLTGDQQDRMNTLDPGVFPRNRLLTSTTLRVDLLRTIGVVPPSPQFQGIVPNLRFQEDAPTLTQIGRTGGINRTPRVRFTDTPTEIRADVVLPSFEEVSGRNLTATQRNDMFNREIINDPNRGIGINTISQNRFFTGQETSAPTHTSLSSILSSKHILSTKNQELKEMLESLSIRTSLERTEKGISFTVDLFLGDEQISGDTQELDLDD